MRMVRTVIILVVVLGGLIGALFYAKHVQEKKGTDDGTEKTIYKVKKDDITEVTIKNAGGTVTLYKDKDLWKARGHEDVRLNQNSADNPSYFISDLKATDTITDAGNDLAKYGLENPISTVEAKLKNGKLKRFFLGNQTAAKDGYYMKMEGDKNVYIIWTSAGDSFGQSLDTLRELALVKLVPEDVRYIYLQRKDKPTIKLVYTGANELGMTNWAMQEPYERDVDTKYLQDIINAIGAVKLKDFVTADMSNPAQYGLDDPAATIEARDKSGRVLKLIVGKDKDESTVYCTKGDGSGIFTVDKSLLAFKNTPVFALAGKFVYITSIDTVDKLSVSAPGVSADMSITRKKIKNDQGEDDTEATYYLDGKKVEFEPFTTYYQSLIGLIVDGEAAKPIEGTPDITVTFTRSENPKTVTLQFIPYDVDNYGVVVNGEGRFYINKDKVNSMLDVLKQFKEGKLKTQ